MHSYYCLINLPTICPFKMHKEQGSMHITSISMLSKREWGGGEAQIHK